MTLHTIIPLVIIGSVVLWAFWAYNGLVRLRNQVSNAWRQIDVQLKRRHDLIPNLVNTVRGAMKFEQETLEKVIQARSRAIDAAGISEKAGAESVLTAALGRLFALVENYPEIKSNKNILQLQEELVSTENRIGFARQFYNDLVARFNTMQEVFPTTIIAGATGFKKAEYFKAEAGARAVPGVDLNMERPVAPVAARGSEGGATP